MCRTNWPRRQRGGTQAAACPASLLLLLLLPLALLEPSSARAQLPDSNTDGAVHTQWHASGGDGGAGAGGRRPPHDLPTSLRTLLQMGPRIVGGTVAPQSRYPYLASLRDPSGSHYCGGALVAPNVVVTAAHCVWDKSLRSPTLHIGRRFLTTSETGYDVRQVTATAIHPSYDPATSQNDIAVLLLSSPSTKSPLRLPSADLSLPDNAPLTAIGFGTTSEGSFSLSETLQQVTISYITTPRCTSTVYTNGEVKPGMLCAGELAGGKDSCQGDSGGPLLSAGESAATDMAVGLVSWGVGCARANLPGVYTDVAFYRSWIATYVNQWGTPAASPPPPPATLPSPPPPPPVKLPSPPPPPPVKLPSPPPPPPVKLPSPPPPPPVKLPSPPPPPPVKLPSPPPPVQTTPSDTTADCSCSRTGISGGVRTERKGCARHDASVTPLLHCYTAGGNRCPQARPSPLFPNTAAAWVPCGADAQATIPTPTAPRVPTVTLTGPGVISNAVGVIPSTGATSPAPANPASTGPTITTFSSGPAQSQGELCRCSSDGVSAGIKTERKGCRVHGFPSDMTRHCYVVGGTECTSATSSNAFKGTAWKPCRSDAD